MIPRIGELILIVLQPCLLAVFASVAGDKHFQHPCDQETLLVIFIEMAMFILLVLHFLGVASAIPCYFPKVTLLLTTHRVAHQHLRHHLISVVLWAGHASATQFVKIQQYLGDLPVVAA
jgi:hypothetical protein